MRTYTFKVSLRYRRGMHRIIEVEENQTLDRLHLAIQEAINWDADHLYSFFMSGKARDSETEYAPHIPEADMFVHKSRDTKKVKIKDLKLTPGQKFLYLFDYGDDHRFNVELLSINENAPKDDYPKLVESKGRAPEQYPSYEE